MSKLSIRTGILLGAMLLALPGFAGDVKIDVDGHVRTGWEYLSNYYDAQDHDDATLDDDFDFFPYRALLGVNAQFGDKVVGRVAVQNIGHFGDDPGTAFPTGAPADSAIDLSSSDVNVYEAFIHINDIFGDDHWSARIGRSEHSFGNELHIGVNEYYGGNSYDGVRFSGAYDSFGVDVFHYELIESSFFGGQNSLNFAFGDPLSSGGILGTGIVLDENDQTLTGLTFDIDLTDNGQNIKPYVLDHRQNNFSTDFGFNVYTIGALYGRFIESHEDVEDLAFDWSIEAAIQTGDEFSAPGLADLDAGGSIVEGSFGFNWLRGENHNRVHVGFLQASGDDDGAADGDQDAFRPLIPDMHAGNRLGDLDLFGGGSAVNNPFVKPGGFSGLSNITDISLGYRGSCADGRHSYMASLHQLSLTDEPNVAGAEDDLGLELDLVYNFQHSDHLGFEAGIANLFPGDALDAAVAATIAGATEADDILRFWWRFNLDW